MLGSLVRPMAKKWHKSMEKLTDAPSIRYLGLSVAMPSRQSGGPA